MTAMVTLHSKGQRDKVAHWAANAPHGTRVTFARPVRTLPQNDRMWVLLTAVADQLEWHGAKWPPEDWKDYFMHSLTGLRFMPHESGGMIPIGRRTSKLDKEQHGMLMDLIEAFAAEHGVDLGGEE
jgi:hypothetical protein